MKLADFLNAWASRRQKRWEIRNLMKAQRIAAGLTIAQRLKGPTERQGVTLGLFFMAVMMLLMAREDPKLWEVKLFEVVFQAVILTGLLNMVVAFHFAANKGDETKSENTGKLADAFRSVAENSTSAPTADAADAAEETANAAVEKAYEIREEQQ